MRGTAHILASLLASGSRIGLASIVLVGAGFGIAAAGAATVTLPRAATARTQDDPGQQHAADPDPASRNVVARARMLECGHQWSNMKRAGTASGTWKDFSRGCLAQR